MSIQRINPDDIETFTLETNPVRNFSSSSNGTTGSVRIFPRGSTIEKEVQPLSQFSSSFFTDVNIDEYINNVKRQLARSTNVSSSVENYLQIVNEQDQSLRKQQEVEIIRFIPPTDLNSDTLRKNIVTNNLMSYYRHVYPTANFNYTNYNCLNFFTASSVPENTALLYPNSSSATQPMGYYAPTGAFSFDFWINPRYKGEAESAFKAGTILHLSSCYAVSLVTGSQKDVNGYASGFRILLQLSHSAEIKPSNIGTSTTGTFPNDLVFFSDDNSLTRNHWHHVTIRWGTDSYNNGSGSFIIDGESKGTFVIPSSSIIPSSDNFGGVGLRDLPRMLCVGNFYEGTNTGLDSQSEFFSEAISVKDGILQLSTSSNTWHPSNYTLAHPLNAEIHDLKIYNKYLVNSEIETLRSGGPSNINDLLLFVPPFFTRESPYRQYVTDLGAGGVMITPFFEEDGTTIEPFNTKFSFGVGGHEINLENFVKDFATGNFPRLFNLTSSIITNQANVIETANDYLYITGSNIKRNLTILPCDNGTFYPNFNFLRDGSNLRNYTAPTTVTVTGSTDKFRNDLGNYDYASITLRELATTSSYRTGLVYSTGSIVDDIVGARPESLNSTTGSVLTILQRTRDNTSNQVCFFDVSNLYYGKYIKPSSLTITDNYLTGSDNKVKITLKDDGRGNVYRADSETDHATWSSVGNVFYNEGIVLIKSPHLYFFGKDSFDMSFQGVQNIHILTFNLAARPAQMTSSSNPAYLPVSASDAANDSDQRFVYINQVLLHDDNLNVVMKAQLAQPLVKRTGDKLMFRIKYDY